MTNDDILADAGDASNDRCACQGILDTDLNAPAEAESAHSAAQMTNDDIPADTGNLSNDRCACQGIPDTDFKAPAEAESAHSVAQMKDGLRDGSIYGGERFVDRQASVNHQSSRAPFVRLQGRSVAPELVWLITEGRLTFGGLFRLQRLASQVPGQRLCDFVSLRSERLKQLPTTGDCYRYLKRLIDDQLDARYLCAQRAKREHQAHRREQLEAAAASRSVWCRNRHGMTFVDPATERTYKVNANHHLLELGIQGIPSHQPCQRINDGFILAVEQGRLIPFKVSERIDREEGSRRLRQMREALGWLRATGRG